VTTICVADELAAASELVMGKVDAIPAAIVRGFDYERGDGSTSEIIRAWENDLFL
jgi:coenzyme F420-0:L-glutamate ligase/coenzyme F420-1:gamma-L-glutamate ligase